MPLQKMMQKMEQSSCMEDRIQHALGRCLCDLGLDCPDKQLWNAGLCINRWCLEELVKRDPRNFLILLQQILRKTKEVFLQCQYELVVPLTLMFSSTLMNTPHMPPDCGMLQEAYLLLHGFLSWPEPCCSAIKRLLNIIQQELRAPGISFQRLVRTEQGFPAQIHSSKVMTMLLVSPDQDMAPQVQAVSEQLSSTRCSHRDAAVSLILHAFQATLGAKHNLQTLHDVLQTKQPEELQQLLEAITDIMETAASTSDLSVAREGLLHRMERLAESLKVPDPADSCSGAEAVEMLVLPFPKCHISSWENSNFDILSDILASEFGQDSPPDCFLKTEIDEDNTEVNKDEEEEVAGNNEDHCFSTASSSSRDSMFSSYSLPSTWSVPSTQSGSSGVDSDCSEDTGHEDTEEGQDSQPKPRKKPKKKSRSLLGVERLSMLFRSPRSPSICRHAQSMGYGENFKDFPRPGVKFKCAKSLQRQGYPPYASPPLLNQDPRPPQKHMCIRRRPILSCDESDVAEVVTLVRVVVFGGDKEAGRLARAYSDLQQKESRCPRLPKTCKLQFYFVPTKRRLTGSPARGNTPTEGLTESSFKATLCEEANGLILEDNTTNIAQILGVIDPWYERNVLSLLSLSSDVLCQTVCKEDGDSESRGGTEQLPLLADLVLYYCRHADQPVLVQLYQAELTLVGGERRREVFIHSLELGHTAGTRAVKAMGAASKRFGIDGEREAVPLTLSIAYNKVAISGRGQWSQAEMVCTSINLYKACGKSDQLDPTIESLKLRMTEVLKRQCSKSKKGYNQHISVSEAKVDKVQVSGGDNGTTFAVCLDQDEKKIIQSVTRCEVSLCCKPGSSSDWRSYKPLPGQIQPLHPSYCSLLCLPITSFSASYL